MKKIIFILSMVVLTTALFLPMNQEYSKEDSFDLASLISMNIANAESTPINGCRYTGNPMDACRVTFMIVTNCVNTIYAANCGI